MNYTYAAVERALANIFDISRDRLGMFRGRIKHLQRIGLVPSSPGPGKRITYSFEDVAKWALALEIAEFGIDPTVCIVVVADLWPVVGPSALHLLRGLLVCEPSIMSDPQGWTTTATVTDRTGLLTIVQTWPRRLMVFDLEHLYAGLADALEMARRQAEMAVGQGRVMVLDE